MPKVLLLYFELEMSSITHTQETVVDVTYSADYDLFFLKVRGEKGRDVAITTLGDQEDFLAFDNARAGKLVSGAFKASNRFALDTMRRLFDGDFLEASEGMRKSARMLKNSAIKMEMFVPYTHDRRMSRIALHAKSSQASDSIKHLAEKVTS